MGQLREHDTNARVGTPDAAAREAIDAGNEAAIGTDVHVRNEELLADLEQEERAVAIRAKPCAMLPHEQNDLALCKTQRVQVVVHAAEDLGECSVLDHLVDGDIRLLGRLALHIATVVPEVRVEVAVEQVTRLGDGFLAVRRLESEGFRARDEAKMADDRANRSVFRSTLGNHQFITEKSPEGFLSTDLVDPRFDLSKSQIAVLHSTQFLSGCLPLKFLAARELGLVYTVNKHSKNYAGIIPYLIEKARFLLMDVTGVEPANPRW